MYSGCLLTCSDMNAIIVQRTEEGSIEKLCKRSYRTVCSDAKSCSSVAASAEAGA